MEDHCEIIQTNSSEMVEVVEVDLHALCRLCGQIKDALIPIFEGDGRDNEIMVKINKYLPIQVAESDSLSIKICIQCTNVLLVWHDLYTNCLEVDMKFSNMIKVSEELWKINEEEDIEEDNADSISESQNVYENEEYVDEQLKDDEENLDENESKDINEQEQSDEEEVEQLAEVESKRFIRCSITPTDPIPSHHDDSKLKIEFDDQESPSVEYNFKCFECEFDCKQKADMLEHIRKLHKTQPIKRRQRTNRNSVKMVLDLEKVDAARVLTDGKVCFQCPHCSKRLNSPYSFQWHLRIHSGERPFECSLCDKKFRIFQGLSRHMKEFHEKERIFPCDICGRKFGNSRNVKEHRYLHTNERPYKCDQCDKTFNQKASLYIHKRSHTSDFPFRCTHCDQRFRSKHPLLLHLKIHTGDKPHQCDVCDRKFRIKHELNKHKLIHTDIKPFECEFCQSKFRQKRYIVKHYKVHHPTALESLLTNLNSKSNHMKPTFNAI